MILEGNLDRYKRMKNDGNVKYMDKYKNIFPIVKIF